MRKESSLGASRYFSPQISNCLKRACVDFDLHLELLCALIHVESSGNPWASRFEPKFYEKYIKGKAPKELPGFFPSVHVCTPQTENFNRSRSIGLFQIMGNTARLHGFEKPFLDELFDIPTNIEMGCKILSSFIRDCKGDTRSALLKWNGGGDKGYPDRVMDALRQEKGAYLLAV